MNRAINTAPAPLAAIQASRRRNGLVMLCIHSRHASGSLGRWQQGPRTHAEQQLLATARLYGSLELVWPASLRAVFTCTSDHRPKRIIGPHNRLGSSRPLGRRSNLGDAPGVVRRLLQVGELLVQV